MDDLVKAVDFAAEHTKVVERAFGHAKLLGLAAEGLREVLPEAAVGLSQISIDLQEDSEQMLNLMGLVQEAIRSGHLKGVVPVPPRAMGQAPQKIAAT